MVCMHTVRRTAGSSVSRHTVCLRGNCALYCACSAGGPLCGQAVASCSVVHTGLRQLVLSVANASFARRIQHNLCCRMHCPASLPAAALLECTAFLCACTAVTAESFCMYCCTACCVGCCIAVPLAVDASSACTCTVQVANVGSAAAVTVLCMACWDCLGLFSGDWSGLSLIRVTHTTCIHLHRLYHRSAVLGLHISVLVALFSLIGCCTAVHCAGGDWVRAAVADHAQLIGKP